MARIIEKTKLNKNTIKFVVKAPAIAKKPCLGNLLF